jgi:hypothetical protein
MLLVLVSYTSDLVQNSAVSHHITQASLSLLLFGFLYRCWIDLEPTTAETTLIVSRVQLMR